MSNELPEAPKHNWPLIWVVVIVGLLLLATVAACVAMYVTNFNLLEWTE